MVDIFNQIYINKGSSLPIVNQLSDQVKWLIVNGEIKTGDHLPTIREAAKRLGIHMHTVRSAYHLLERMNLVTTRPREGTIVRPYQPFQFMGETSSTITHKVGVIVSAFYPTFNDFMRGVENVARKNILLTMITSTDDTASMLERSFDQMLNHQVDGVIYACMGFSDKLQVQFDLADLHLPIPIVSAAIPSASHSAVLFDIEGAASQAVTHLLDHGHQSIGLITISEEWPCGGELTSGFQRGLREKGAMINQVFINTVTSLSIEAGYQAGLKLVNSTIRPTAVFAVDDALAVGAMRAFGKKGMRVPEDISVIGFHNIQAAEMIEPPLTTIDAPMYELGEKSMQMLLRLIHQKIFHCENVILPTRLVVRRSCGCNQ